MAFLGPRFDFWLHHPPTAAARAAWPAGCQLLPTAAGPIRLLDTASAGPVVVMVPDGPCVLEHHAALIAQLGTRFRVVCFDMPGFGFSVPAARYSHSLADGAGVVLAVLDALQIPRAALAFGCANGFYALEAARRAPERLSHLVLAQTPSLSAMHAWVQRTVPWPLRVAGVGQLLARAGREPLARRWLRTALPRGTDAAPWQATAHRALHQGGCFCLAGVVQGLMADLPQAATLTQTRVPTTLVWGGQDRSHRPTAPPPRFRRGPTRRGLRWSSSPIAGIFPTSNSRLASRNYCARRCCLLGPKKRFELIF